MNLERIVLGPINAILNKVVPSGWISVLGILSLLVLYVLNLLGKIDSAQFTQWSALASAVTGIGILRKDTKSGEV